MVLYAFPLSNRLRADRRFLPMPGDLIRELCDKVGGAPGAIPHLLLRGVQGDVPSMLREPQCIYARSDTPDAFAYELTKALDDHRDLFRRSQNPPSVLSMRVPTSVRLVGRIRTRSMQPACSSPTTRPSRSG